MSVERKDYELLWSLSYNLHSPASEVGRLRDRLLGARDDLRDSARQLRLEADDHDLLATRINGQIEELEDALSKLGALRSD